MFSLEKIKKRLKKAIKWWKNMTILVTVKIMPFNKNNNKMEEVPGDILKHVLGNKSL